MALECMLVMQGLVHAVGTQERPFPVFTPGTFLRSSLQRCLPLIPVPLLFSLTWRAGNQPHKVECCWKTEVGPPTD